MIKDLIILGSTGSIGTSTLKIIKKNRKQFKVKLLTTNKNIKRVLDQALEFNVKKVVINDNKKYFNYSHLFKKNKIKVYFNINKALRDINKKVYFTISAISGIEGLEPTIDVIKFTKNLGIANKESIICGWKFINYELKKYKTNFIPLDSEHFSVWSLIKDENKDNIKKIYLTASGGPFLNKKLKEIENVNPKQALKHPNWKMGKKISIDSATMINKIFEVMEAYRLFDLKSHQINIVIHPQSIVHAIVNYKNGTSHALLHNTDMRIPISSGLCNDNINDRSKFGEFNINKFNKMNFYKISTLKFPSLNILKNISEKCTLFDTVLISANDELVDLFLKDKIQFNDIILNLKRIIKLKSFNKYKSIKPKNFKEIQELNHSVRLKTRSICI
mgnify:CR=1 FL=1